MASVSLQLTLGSLSEGNPPWTGPMTEETVFRKMRHALAAIAPTPR